MYKIGDLVFVVNSTYLTIGINTIQEVKSNRPEVKQVFIGNSPLCFYYNEVQKLTKIQGRFYGKNLVL